MLCCPARYQATVYAGARPSASKLLGPSVWSMIATWGMGAATVGGETETEKETPPRGNFVAAPTALCLCALCPLPSPGCVGDMVVLILGPAMV